MHTSKFYVGVYSTFELKLYGQNKDRRPPPFPSSNERMEIRKKTLLFSMSSITIKSTNDPGGFRSLGIGIDPIHLCCNLLPSCLFASALFGTTIDFLRSPFPTSVHPRCPVLRASAGPASWTPPQQFTLQSTVSSPPFCTHRGGGTTCNRIARKAAIYTSFFGTSPVVAPNVAPR